MNSIGYIDVDASVSESGVELDLGPIEPIEVSVVIPCLNERNSLGICIDKAFAAFRRAGINGEVVVADNGSTDGSIEIAREHGARVAPVPTRGYGNALRGGFKQALGQFMIMGDADDSYDFSEIPLFVAKWREGYEFVIGNRLEGNIKPGAMPWLHRYFGTPVMSAILNMFFGAGIGDVNCGMRGITRNLYDRLDLRTTGMEFASELVVKAAKLKVPLAEIPISLWPDKRGRPPHLRSFRDGWRHLRFMLLLAPDWLFFLPGALLFLLGVGVLLWLLPGPRDVGPIVLDVHTMLFGAMFALLGEQLVCIAMFAKVFSYTERFSRDTRSLEKWLKRVTLEAGLIVGSIPVLVGVSGSFWALWKWMSSGFGPMNDLRLVICFTFCILFGIEIVFASFFLSMLGISRGTYIGDYDIQ